MTPQALPQPLHSHRKRDHLSAGQFHTFQKFLYERSGIILADSKRYLVQSRLGSILAETGSASVEDLIHDLIHGRLPDQVHTRVIDAITTNETFWFRDLSQFQLLQDHLLKQLSRQRFGTLRIWSAACATGQEPYSIAICIREAMRNGTLPKTASFRIIGTDLSHHALRTACRGVYSGLALSRGLPECLKQRYFMACEAGWKPKPEITSLVKFQSFNLLKPYTALGRFELILCRNVLIYFSPEVKRDILERMAGALQRGGCLFLSSTESLPPDFDGLVPTRKAGVRFYIHP